MLLAAYDFLLNTLTTSIARQSKILFLPRISIYKECKKINIFFTNVIYMVWETKETRKLRN